MIVFNLFFTSELPVSLLVIKITPIPAQIIKIEVEFPINRFVNCPGKDLSANVPKQNVKFTMYIPNMAYALAKSNPIILFVIIRFVLNMGAVSEPCC